jgi:hypothetical protein
MPAELIRTGAFVPLMPRIIFETLGELLLRASTKRMCDKDSLIGFSFMVTPLSCTMQFWVMQFAEK